MTTLVLTTADRLVPFFKATVFLGILLGVAQTARADAENYRRTLQATTWVLAKNSAGTSSGTGVLIDAERKLVVTNAHVVGDARTAVIFFPDMQGNQPQVARKHYLDNVKKLGIRGQVISVDRKRDLALIELDRLSAGARAVELAPASCSPGETVESIGNPGSTEALWVYTSGTVRAVYQKQFRTGAGEHDFTVVESQSPINTGDSGGPVVNDKGQLVAISQAISPKGRLVSYFVDISEVKTFLDSPWKPAPLPVAKVLQAIDLVFVEQDSGHLEVELESVDKQKQKVFIGKEVEYFERADVRKIWSLAATLKKSPSLETVMKLLQQNSRTKIGSWSIDQTPQGEFLVIYLVNIDATASPDAVKSTMDYVARLTGAMKKELEQPESEQVESAGDTLESWLK